jgi:hypothetical protein
MLGVGRLRRNDDHEGIVVVRLRPAVVMGGWSVLVTSIAPGERRKVTESGWASTLAGAQRVGSRLERRIRRVWAAEAAERSRRRHRRHKLRPGA